MPRPGPRPYECVRRAWHSERHQPMRGLIIQHIFRLVHGNHSAVTKKNKEWQEKLPVLVLKSEEIMYSKANSEGEYSNPETVWERVNDAIDTIIRKDESTEIGELLPPCVEAALNLGCVPVRASRSQRHNNPRTYLRPAYQNSPKFPNEHPSQHNSSSMPLHTPNIDSPPSMWDCSNKRILPNTNRTEVEHNASFNRGSVYPLYYGTSFKSSHSGSQEHQKPDSIIVGVPIFSSVPETTQVGYLHNLFPYDGKDENVTKDTSKGKEIEMDCDLSLRLGIDSGHQYHPNEKEFSFFPVESTYDRLGSSRSGRWDYEGENLDMELASRKRKLPFDANVEYKQFL